MGTASCKGVITDINEEFTKTFHWQRDEIVGQNIHILIPSKFIRLSSHDKKVRNYYYGRESRIIGKSRIVPVSTANDEEILVRIQIIPLGDKKDYSFMAILDVINFDRQFFDFPGEFENLRVRMERDPEEEFREDSPDCRSIVKSIGLLFGEELSVVGEFIVQNSHSSSVVRMSKYFLLSSPIGRLGKLKKLMDRVYDNDDISYLNVTCLRLVFPSLVDRIDLTLLNALRTNLYADVHGESGSKRGSSLFVPHALFCVFVHQNLSPGPISCMPLYL